ncbi:hypothetical protein CFAM422_008720 [Trichoderma lentiforme]|uniref:NmrA-like domain-containing protein n=1 Tax=Trichoderma lentiforme TaxID=1567552 RepID=A0A9P4XBJ9_9HYPO|nr:hypothetical protein CFAM422_008720 [Trichoderma lentiforme]
MSDVKNVAVFGGGGSLAAVIVPILHKHFNVTMIRRCGSNSKAPVNGIKVIDADFSSEDDLAIALKGNDAVICMVASSAHKIQPILIDAAVAAGVRRFIPSEFGANIDNAKTRQLPVFAGKVATQEYLKNKAKTTNLSYTFIYNGAFLDWGLEHGVLIDLGPSNNSKIYNGGDSLWATTTRTTVAEAVVSVLKHLEETKNRPVFIQDAYITQNKLLRLAQEVTPPRSWATTAIELDDITSVADKKVTEGKFDGSVAMAYITRALFDPEYGCNFATSDNQLLGLQGKTDEDIKAVIQTIIRW